MLRDITTFHTFIAEMLICENSLRLITAGKKVYHHDNNVETSPAEIRNFIQLFRFLSMDVLPSQFSVLPANMRHGNSNKFAGVPFVHLSPRRSRKKLKLQRISTTGNDEDEGGLKVPKNEREGEMQRSVFEWSESIHHSFKRQLGVI